jgi:hypothetical protein
MPSVVPLRRFACWLLLIAALLAPAVSGAMPPAQTTATTTIILLPFGASPSQDKLWVSTTGGWTGLTPPAAAMYWRWIAADPFHPDRWLLLGNSIPSAEQFTQTGGEVRMRNGVTPPLWFTDSAGARWTPVRLTDSAAITYRFDTVEFDTSAPGAWFLAGLRDTATTREGVLWRGVGAGSGAPVLLPTMPDPRHLSPGQQGDVILAADNEGAARFGYVAGGSGSGVVVGSGYQLGIDRLPGASRAVVGVDRNGGPLLATADYRSSGPTPRTSDSVGGVLTAAEDGIYVGNRCCGLLHIADPLSAATRSISVGAEEAIGFVRADRQTRTAVAALQATNFTTLYLRPGLGRAWTTIPTPSREIANRVEVIVAAQPAPPPTPTPTPLPQPPLATTSYYLQSSNLRLAMQLGCNARVRGERGIVLLAFGAPSTRRTFNSQTHDYETAYGAKLLNQRTTVYASAIKELVTAFAIGYTNPTLAYLNYRCTGVPAPSTLRPANLTIALGVSNSAVIRQGVWQDNVDLTADHGAAWAEMINQLDTSFQAPRQISGQIIRLYPAVGVAAAYDAEYYQAAFADVRDPKTGRRGASIAADEWTTYGPTKAWADGYHSVASRTKRLPYYNYGSCEDCPRTGTPDQWRGRSSGAILDRVYRLSWRRSNRPLPQIYYAPYPGQWYNLRWYVSTQYGHEMAFEGVMTQCNSQRCTTAPTGRIAPFSCITDTSGTRCTGEWSSFSCTQQSCLNFPPSQAWQALADVLRSPTTPQNTPNPALGRQLQLNVVTNIKTQSMKASP